MDLISILVVVLVVFVLAWLAHWIITTFFPAPIQMIALVIVGIILLLLILRLFVGGPLPTVKW